MNLSRTIPNKIDKVVYIMICSNTNAFILFDRALANLATVQQNVERCRLSSFIKVYLH